MNKQISSLGNIKVCTAQKKKKRREKNKIEVAPAPTAAAAALQKKKNGNVLNLISYTCFFQNEMKRNKNERRKSTRKKKTPDLQHTYNVFILYLKKKYVYGRIKTEQRANNI